MSLAMTIWLTGLSGAGKSTLAEALAKDMRAVGAAVSVLDGDVLRAGLCKDLGFTLADRSENIRRVAEVARLMNAEGVTVICALISPLRVDRAMAREIIGADQFFEVYVATSLAVCEGRDPKGLYKRARAGEIPEFTGIDSVYEPPSSPDATVETACRSVECCIAELLCKVRLWAGGHEG